MLFIMLILKDGEKMAIKKTETKTAAAPVKVEAAKTEPVKVETAKTEPVKAAAPVKVETAVKTEPVKKTVKKTTKKETAPKKAAAKKTPVKQTGVVEANLYIQYAGKQFSQEEIINKCKEAAASSMGKKRLSSVQSIDVYCKPEEHVAYYVANGNVAGRIDL